MNTNAPANVYTAIAHPLRRRILDLLAERERPVSDIARHFGVSRPAVSQHLRILLDAGLVVRNRHGRERLYRLTPQPLEQVSDWLTHYERFWRHRLQRLGKYLDTTIDATTDEETST